jgi:hypothetical protein
MDKWDVVRAVVGTRGLRRVEALRNRIVERLEGRRITVLTEQEGRRPAAGLRAGE